MIVYLSALLFALTLLNRWAFIVALLFEGYYLFERGFSLGRLPLVGVHDTLLFLSFSTGVFALCLFLYRRKLPWAEPLLKTAALLCAVLSLSATLSAPYSMPLPPVLQTFWFELHVTLSFLSYGIFGVASLIGVVCLKKGELRGEYEQYILVLTGYLLFSLSMVFGGIWAYYAWGTYWLWTPKELWTSLLWLFYTLYLHLRFRPGWMGRRTLMLGTAGYGVVLFTYLGVGLLMKSSHSF
ncbi:MAG: cytochrome C biogenesis protein ResC [Nitrospirae bacterium]|nr:MAG: cytochrome C biogenesis protein ResC [Nitrospirota bacterium]